MPDSDPEQLGFSFAPPDSKAVRGNRLNIPKPELISLEKRREYMRSLRSMTLKSHISYLPRTAIDFINRHLKQLSEESGSGVRLIGKFREGELGNFQIFANRVDRVCEILSSSHELGFSVRASGDHMGIYRDSSKEEDPQESLGGGIKKRQ